MRLSTNEAIKVGTKRGGGGEERGKGEKKSISLKILTKKNEKYERK